MNRSVLVVLIMMAVLPFSAAARSATYTQEIDVQTQQLVGKIVSIRESDQSFDLEYFFEDGAGDKKTDTFYVTDITTIDIAMTQAALSDLKPGLNVLVEFAQMPDGTRVVESVWVKSS